MKRWIAAIVFVVAGLWANTVDQHANLTWAQQADISAAA
jgi:hypothetical protein